MSTQRARRSRRLLLAIVLSIVPLYLILQVVMRLWVEALWFAELGFVDVFTTHLTTRLGLGVVAFVVAFTVLAVNCRTALRSAPRLRLHRGGELDMQLAEIERRLPSLAWLATGVLALGLAASVSGDWLSFQVFANSQTYGKNDPIFGLDIGFYLFRLPFLRSVQTWLMVVVILSGIFSLGIYAVRGSFSERRMLPPALRRHLGFLGVFFFLLLASHFALSQFDMLFSAQGTVHGAGFTDVRAGLPGIRVLIAASLAMAVVTIVATLRHLPRLLLGGAAALFALYLLAIALLPAGVQKFIVEPNELAKEKTYIEYALQWTREAYDLEEIEERNFDFDRDMTIDLVRERRNEVENIRLWDYRLLLPTYRQIQEIRLYYNFGDVDVDRYVIDGRYRQVMLSARELAGDQIPLEARTWLNRHLQYTHGYGLCMSPVNAITPEGLPELFIRNIPPVTDIDISIERPEIYYGEQTSDFSVVLTSIDEFDYPLGESNQYTRYQGEGGISVGSLWRRLLFAWHLGTGELLFTRYLTDESRILLHRSLTQRVPRIAPFLKYDGDPYLVVDDGRLFWVIDAYTFSRSFPYSQPRNGVNYIRNSVKVVVDAFHGTTTFYGMPTDDPVFEVYRKIFPSLFRPLSEMSASLRAHLRYPVDLFRMQAETYATYHMEDPQVFYNKEDLWQLPIESFAGREVLMEPYYTVLRLPDSDEEELVLMMPFTPSRKDNMIAWMAARCDGANLGRRMVFLFPKQELVYGPRQIEARIDQDAVISQQLTLWSQRGSDVIRGNLLVIPVGNSILYVEPLYLQAEKGALPELKRVIVAHGNRIEMDSNLEKTLQRLVGRMPAQVRPAQLNPAAAAPSATAPSVAERALAIFRAAEKALEEADWQAYGQEWVKLRDLLEAESQAGQSARTPDP